MSEALVGLAELERSLNHTFSPGNNWELSIWHPSELNERWPPAKEDMRLPEATSGLPMTYSRLRA
jgi:hypothetical protein